MVVLWVVVVIGVIEVGGYDVVVVYVVVGVELVVVVFVEFDVGDFGYGVGFVGGFEWFGE